MFEIKSREIKLLLRYFFFNPSKKYYSSELAARLNLDASNVNKSLRKLTQEGILGKEKRGGHWFYFLNREYPLLNEAKKIFLFKYGLDKFLGGKLKTIKGLEEAYIYGSYAKGGLEAESDIDILLIGSHSSLKAVEKLIELQNYFGREFNSVDMSREEFDKRKRGEDEFIKNIFSDRIIRIL